MRVPVRAIMVAVLALAVAPGTVAAHAQLLASTPAADAVLTSLPPAVSLTYDDPLLPSSSVEVVDGTGATVTSGSVDPADDHSLRAPLPNLPNGQYEVRWTAATDDGHIERGTFKFTVAIATATPAPATEALATPAASPAASGPATETPTPAASSATSTAPTAALTGSSGDTAGSGDVVIPIVAGLAIVGAGLAWFLRRRRAG